MNNYFKMFAVAVVTLGTWAVFSAPASAYSGGSHCREYTRTVFIGNKRQEAYGTACLQPDGQWRIVNEGNLRPVSYDHYAAQNRTIVVQQPTQVVYRDRTPTRVYFFGAPKRYNNNHHFHGHRYDRKQVHYHGHNRHHRRR